jgi:para-nitrobenzyl esterase
VKTTIEASNRQPQAAVVEIAGGKIIGGSIDGVSTFRGIPYAASPTGALRFAAPQAREPWSGVLDCNSPGFIAPQAPSRLRAVMGDFDDAQDEDCLTVTVWAPAHMATPKPVLVWLHGGAYMSGAGALDWYSGERLAREGDIVVVGVNYRLGALGYLYHPKVASGNMGLLDQHAALQWVQDNIARFGGDPGCVTLCGQSAGAASAAFLVTRPQSRTLFHRCILQSGPLGLEPHSRDAAIRNAEQLFAELGLSADDSDLRAKLESIPVAKILAAQSAAIAKIARQLALPPGGQYIPFQPTADGDSLPLAGIAAFDDAAKMVDVIIGTTREEFAAFLAFDPAVQALARPPLPAADLQRLSARRPAGTPAELLGDYLNENLFLKPSLRWAEAASRAGRRAFVYCFDWQSPRRELGACHCVELPFVFGTWDAFARAPMLAGADLTKTEAISRQMRAAWVQFVTTGGVEVAGLPPWPAFDAERRISMRIGEIFEASADPSTATQVTRG